MNENEEQDVAEDDGDEGIVYEPHHYFAILADEYQLFYLGVYNSPVEVMDGQATPGDVAFVIDDTDAIAWVRIVEEHPELDAHFMIRLPSCEFVYLGQFLDETELHNAYAKREDNPLTDGQYLLVNGEQVALWAAVLEEAGVEYTKPGE